MRLRAGHETTHMHNTTYTLNYVHGMTVSSMYYERGSVAGMTYPTLAWGWLVWRGKGR